MFQSDVLPAILLSDIGVATGETGEGFDGDLEVGTEYMTPE